MEAEECFLPSHGQAMRRLGKNMRQLWLPSSVARYTARDIDAITFLRDHVSASMPAIITDLDRQQWPCLDRWSDEYLLGCVGESQVSVNVTPDGLGDFVDAQGRFVKPCEELMSFSDFWRWLTAEPSSCSASKLRTGVPYLSQQNDSLREEMPELLGDVPSAVPLGLEAFGNEPDAVNLWIGDDRAISSCHKDFYENLYLVVRGEKHFTLLPPAAVPFLHEQQCKPARFERSGCGFQVVEEEPAAAHVHWIPFDVASSKDQICERFPHFAQAPIVSAVVRAGEMLYLPAMWYHRVAQQGLTIAVNYWHDMAFGAAYVMYQFVRDSQGLDEASDEDSDAP
mmetsp:Transcript_48033/g.88449  ORF Transcript_48033/g.88449 Transcript_48033/m.88449 type:complete len:339 (-) Transcript_48033:7-1023(-)